MKFADKIKEVDNYIFYELEKKKRMMEAQGKNIIDLSIGDPDIPTPDFVVNSMIRMLKSGKCFNYPPYAGIEPLKEAIAQRYKTKYGVLLDPDTEIAVLIGSKEGISHLILAMTDKDDIVILPDPGYPVYKAASKIAGCGFYEMKLLQEQSFMPDLDDIPVKTADKASLMIVNYPNNPTGATADSALFEKLIAYGCEHDLLIVNDGAYMDIVDDPQKPCSLLQAKDSLNTAIEFGSFSKSYNMTGWRLGYVAGNKKAVSELLKVKTSFDSGQFIPIQYAGIDALKHGDGFIHQMNRLYSQRKQLLYEALDRSGIHFIRSAGTFYIWFEAPKGYDSSGFCEELLDKAGILATPGDVFGSCGKGWCRLSATTSTEKINNATHMLDELMQK